MSDERPYPLKATGTAWLYAMSAGGLPIHKIGTAMDLTERLERMRRRRSYRIEIDFAYAMHSKEAQTLETRLHVELRDKLVGYDWFLIDAVDLERWVHDVARQFEYNLGKRFPSVEMEVTPL